MKLQTIMVLAIVGAIFACEDRGTDPATTQVSSVNVAGRHGGGADSVVAPPEANAAVASITVSMATLPGGRAVQAGDSLGFSAVLRDASGKVLSGRTVTWTTSGDAVLRIDGSFGNYSIARARAAGSATVTAGSEGKSGSTTVTVR